jgi:hypothetical protein
MRKERLLHGEEMEDMRHQLQSLMQRIGQLEGNGVDGEFADIIPEVRTQLSTCIYIEVILILCSHLQLLDFSFCSSLTSNYSNLYMY